jgi:hypothetical protein
MKTVYAGKQVVIGVKQSASGAGAFHVTDVEVNAPTHCGDVHIHFCVFMREWSPSLKKLIVAADFMFVLSI